LPEAKAIIRCPKCKDGGDVVFAFDVPTWMAIDQPIGDMVYTDSEPHYELGDRRKERFECRICGHKWPVPKHIDVRH
jgi:hypothetical protein